MRRRQLEDMLHYAQVRKRIPMYHEYMKRKIFSRSDPYIILPNTYPYIPFHKLFWINPKYTQFYTFTRAKTIILTIYPSATRIFENPVEKQSLKTIRHIHFSLPPQVVVGDEILSINDSLEYTFPQES